MKDEPNRGGRPTLPESKQRRNRIRVQLTDGEFAGLLKACRPGESPGSAIRRILFYSEAN